MFGEVPFEAGGKSYVFKMSVGAIRLVEQHYKQPFSQIMDAANVGFDQVTMCLWAGLFKRYGLTQEAVENIIEQITIQGAEKIIGQSLIDGGERNAEGANGSAHPPSPAMPDLTTIPH